MEAKWLVHSRLLRGQRPCPQSAMPVPSRRPLTLRTSSGAYRMPSRASACPSCPVAGGARRPGSGELPELPGRRRYLVTRTAGPDRPCHQPCPGNPCPPSCPPAGGLSVRRGTSTPGDSRDWIVSRVARRVRVGTAFSGMIVLVPVAYELEAIMSRIRVPDIGRKHPSLLLV